MNSVDPVAVAEAERAAAQARSVAERRRLGLPDIRSRRAQRWVDDTMTRLRQPVDPVERQAQLRRVREILADG